MTSQQSPGAHRSTRAAVEAVTRGFQPIPIPHQAKKPSLTAWTRMEWSPDNLAEVQEKFDEWAEAGMTNLGLLLGEPSGGLVDVDLDHPKTTRLKDHFLPRTAMRSGRAGRPNSHYWYVATGGTLPGTRRYKMADKAAVSVELRSTLAQTVIPPSVHPTGEDYAWSSEPWGGEDGPTVIDGRVLAVQVALLGLGTVLIDRWPEEGSRHEAYLALAGGLLRYGQGVHPYWERNLPILIGALADATNDDDGPETRVAETMDTTLRRLRAGQEATGFGALTEMIGEEHVRQIRLMAREVESLAGFQAEAVEHEHIDERDVDAMTDAAKADAATTPDDERDPLAERVVSWEPVDLDPYLAGEVTVPEPTVLNRDDGLGLMYEGRVNMLYGPSESAKSWVALHTSQQEMARGNRVMYLDFEDEPVSTLERLIALGASPDDVRMSFTYIRPEDPLEPMQRNRWGQVNASDSGRLNQQVFQKALDRVDPALIVADGMTVLYGLHGLDSNDAVSTDVITGWLKKLTRNGRTTVIIIDHTVKSAEKGSMPIGSQHKVAMVQGTLLQVWPIVQPVPGRVGEMELVVLKDRPGKVRKISGTPSGKAQVAAQVTMDSTIPGVTSMSIAPPPQSAADVAVVNLERSREAKRSVEKREWEEKIKWCFGGELGRALKISDLRKMLEAEPGYTERVVSNAAKRLVEQGWLDQTGTTSNTMYVMALGVEGYDDDEDNDD